MREINEFTLVYRVNGHPSKHGMDFDGRATSAGRVVDEIHQVPSSASHDAPGATFNGIRQFVDRCAPIFKLIFSYTSFETCRRTKITFPPGRCHREHHRKRFPVRLQVGRCRTFPPRRWPDRRRTLTSGTSGTNRWVLVGVSGSSSCSVSPDFCYRTFVSGTRSWRTFYRTEKKNASDLNRRSSPIIYL